MARALRIERPGRRYPFTAQGNERKPIYRNDSEKARKRASWGLNCH